MENQEVYTVILSDYLNTDSGIYVSKHCRLTIFSWASVPVLDFLDKQEKFSTSATCVTKIIDPNGKGSFHS